MQHSELKEKKICVSIAESQVQAAIDAAQNVAEQADVIEIRLDALTSPTITPFIDNISTSILFTNRPTWEGGNYSGEEDDRIQLLLEAVENGEIDQDSYANFRKMEKEKMHFESDALDRKKKDKDFGKMVKDVKKIRKNMKF